VTPVAEEAGDIAEAERLYRILMKSDPTDASAPFNLGNLLRSCTRKLEAEAALRAATRVDPTFADAWYNLSDLLDEQGRSEAAIECLRTALRVAPDYADAMFNLALPSKSICRSNRLLASLSRQRLSIGMGRTGAPIIEIL
jgi:tetratricopeptide (TPR) repeat protein